MPLTGTTIRRTASQDIPQQYLEKVVPENPTAWGVAISTPEGLLINSGEKPTIELIEGTINEESLKSRSIVFSLVNSESAINMEDVCPLTVVEDGDDQKLVVFITGEYTGYKKPDSSHPSYYHFVEEVLKPKVAAFWEMTDGDIDKVFAQIEKPLFKKELLMNAAGPATITLLAANGKCVSFAQGDQWAEYKWGWVSHNLGYARAKEEPKKEEPPKSMLPTKSRSTVREPAAAAKGSQVEAPPTAGAEAVKNYSIRKEKPKPEWSRKDRKLFYQSRIGYLPVGWEENCAIEVWVDPETNQTVKFNEIKKMGIAAVSVPKLNNPGRASGKDTDADNISGSERPTGPAVTDAVLPIMSPKAREHAKDILRREDVKKMIAENGDVITDPNKIKDEEAKLADFGSQLGMKDGLFDYLKLPFSEFRKWNRENPESFENFCWNLRNIVGYSMAKKAQKLTETEVHAVAKEELKPTSSMMPRRKTG